MEFKSKIASEDLQKINDDVRQRGYVDREHILQFLQSIPTNDGEHIIKEVQEWLKALHDDPTYEKVVFPKGDIEAIVSDLDSYGHINSETVLRFKELHGKQVPLG